MRDSTLTLAGTFGELDEDIFTKVKRNFCLKFKPKAPAGVPVLPACYDQSWPGKVERSRSLERPLPLLWPSQRGRVNGMRDPNCSLFFSKSTAANLTRPERLDEVFAALIEFAPQDFGTRAELVSEFHPPVFLGGFPRVNPWSIPKRNDFRWQKQTVPHCLQLLGVPWACVKS